MKRIVVLALVAALCLFVTSVAFGGGGSTLLQGYNAIEGTLGQSHGGPSSTTTPSGTLPFTGMDLGLAGAAALLLVGTGFALRRAARQKQ